MKRTYRTFNQTLREIRQLYEYCNMNLVNLRNYCDAMIKEGKYNDEYVKQIFDRRMY